MNFNKAFDRFHQAKEYGYYSKHSTNPRYYKKESYRNSLDVDAYYLVKNNEFKSDYTPKKGSCDDGPFNGPFLGGIGTSNFSRDTLGYFNRWHLQQGVHINCAINTAFFMIRWEFNGEVFYKKLRIGDDGFDSADVEYAALYPTVYEYYHGEDMPFELLCQYYSPTIPRNYQDSILPVTLFNFYVNPKTEEKLDVSIGMCWPNLVGWKQIHLTSEQRQERLWPTLQNAGNYAYLAENNEKRCHIIQTKKTVGQMSEDMLGNIVISVDSDNSTANSYDASFRESAMTTGYEDKDQLYTITKMEYDMKAKGKLSNSEVTWEAHWHEPLATAVSSKISLEGKDEHVTIALTMDMPISTFGMGRSWYKAYTERFSKDCSQSTDLANYALDNNQRWLEDIQDFHTKALEENMGFDKKIAGVQINELSFVVGGGSILITEPVEELEGCYKLGKGKHFGLLEGFDTGYYYYNTLDLYVYAFMALSRNWPELAEFCFNDYLTAAKLEDKRQNMVYRNGALTDNLVYGKLPHDLGGCAEDPFVRLNAYVFRDDPNMWKDHNPSFIAAFYLHKQTISEEITTDEYKTLKIIADFIAKQDLDDIGIPRHSEFGDSTWDNLDMKGISIYEGGICIAAWKVMQTLAKQFGDKDIEFYTDKLAKAQKNIDILWNGKYYNTTECGKYKNATMADSLFGILLAKKSGLGDLLPTEKIVSHLQCLYQNNVKAYKNGQYGPLLVAEPGKLQYVRDGGDEMQVNEVLVGTAWILASTLKEYGLAEEAKELTMNLRKMLYDISGCQFKTPAAWNNIGQFRAPLNMRPLSIWML